MGSSKSKHDGYPGMDMYQLQRLISQSLERIELLECKAGIETKKWVPGGNSEDFFAASIFKRAKRAKPGP